MNRIHDYQRLEQLYVTSNLDSGAPMSVRGLCRQEGIANSSVVAVQSRKHKWPDKRAAYLARSNEKTLEKLADREAERAAKAADAVDKAYDSVIAILDGLKRDLTATHQVLRGEKWIEEPVMRVTPRDAKLFIDTLLVMIGKPSTIGEERKFGIEITSGDVPVEQLRELVEAARGRAQPATVGGSALPRVEEPRPN